jgi:hypothetical protein
VTIYEIDSNPYDITYTEWVIRWWRWLISIPRSSSPVFDLTGEFCDVSQKNPYVWFLAGTMGGTVTRNCTIPFGKAVLFPIINSFASEPAPTSEKDLEEWCKHETDDIGDVQASLDGEAVDVQKYRLHSRCFTVSMPTDNCLGEPAGEATMASDGYWLFIEPLSPGTHALTSFGSCLAGKIKIGCTIHFLIK